MFDFAAELLARARAWLRGVIHREQIEADIHAEFEHHIAERSAHLVRNGLDPKNAELTARREFGHQEMHREEAREPLSLNAFSQVRFSWLDLKLAFRCLPKYPVLNLAAIFALAVGIPVGLAPSHLARALDAPLPGDHENSLRAIRHWDPGSSDVAPTWDSDFTFWAQSLHSFSSLGAFRTSSYNIASADGRAAPAAGAQLSSSVFQMLGVRALRGRLLQDADFVDGAPDVAVIGYGLWAGRFGADPNVIGRAIRIAGRMHVVVGIAPDGFAFPSNESLWLPLRLSSAERTRVQVIGRLADDVSPAAAQTEMASRGEPPPTTTLAANDAQERARLRIEVVPFGLLFLNLPSGGFAALPEFHLVQALTLVLLLVACGNVAMLIFARTATRLQELAIRTAIGASRSRIVSQVFVETLLLSVIAAAVGLVVVEFVLTHVNLAGLAGESSLPYWLSLGLTSRTIWQAVLLAVVSATVAGVTPALVITGRAIAQHMRGGSRVRFGKLTGALVIADIAVSVAAVGVVVATSAHATDIQAANRATGIAASQYLAAEFRLPSGAGGTDASANERLADSAKLATAQRELVAALERETGIRRVAVGDALPRMEHRSTLYELSHVQHAKDAPLQSTRLARVDVDFFRALGVPLQSGRDFVRNDTEGERRVAVVNTAFVTRALNGLDPIGRRVRFPSRTSASDSSWYEIVGVVGPLGVNLLNPDRGAAVYVPAALGTINPMHLAIHTTAPPTSLTSRVRDVALATEPELVGGRVSALSDIRNGDWYLVMGLAAGLLVLVGVLVALATSGLYAMLSLSVSERTREIGIRAALGATHRTLLLTILRRTLVQIVLGALIGLPVAARAMFELTTTRADGGSIAMSMASSLALSLGVVLVVALSSCLVPARRVLAVQASEAMHANG